MQFEFEYFGEPVAQSRPKFSFKTGHAYEQQKSKNYKDALRNYVQLHVQDKRMLEGPLTFELNVFRSIPKSWSNKKKKLAEEGFIQPTGRPDTDNYIKAVLDALSGVLMKDDSQVTVIIATKTYRDQPGIRVKVEEQYPIDEEESYGNS